MQRYTREKRDSLALLCLALPCLALPCLVSPCLALPRLASPCLALPCLALPCLALPCRGLLYLALPLPCVVLPCRGLFFLALPWLLLCLAVNRPHRSRKFSGRPSHIPFDGEYVFDSDQLLWGGIKHIPRQAIVTPLRLERKK